MYLSNVFIVIAKQLLNAEYEQESPIILVHPRLGFKEK